MQTTLASAIDIFEEDSLKRMILEILSGEWPLSVRKIHTKVIAKKTITYHAVYKTVNQMVKDDILKKQYTGYMVNIEWLESIDEMFRRTQEKHASNEPQYLPDLDGIRNEGETHTIIFSNMEEADKYRKNLQEEYLKSGQTKPYVGLSYHLKSPLVRTERSIKLLNILTKKKMPSFMLVEGNTALDDWCADYYRIHSMKVKTGIKNAVETCEIIIMGDYIVQFFIPEKIRNNIEEIYNKSAKISDVSVPEIHSSVYLENCDTKIIISKNSGIAEQIRQNVMNNFNTDCVSFFSLEGTFIDYSFSVDAIKNLHEKNLLNEKEGKKLVELGERWKNKEIPWDTVMDAQSKYFPLAIKGKKEDEIYAAAHEFSLGRISQILFKNSSKLVGLANSYTKTVAITRLPEEFAQTLSPFLAFDEILGTKLEVKNGVFTGNTVRNLTSSENKEKAFLKWIKDKKISKSFGFGSTQNDIAFLKHTSMPMIINPDKHMEKHAKQFEWKNYSSDRIGDLLEYMRKIFRDDAYEK